MFDNLILTKPQVSAELLQGEKKPDTEVMKHWHFYSCPQYVNWWPFWDWKVNMEWIYALWSWSEYNYIQDANEPRHEWQWETEGLG